MKKNLFRTAAVTSEQVVYAGRCLLYRTAPDLATNAGTVTIRDAAVAGGSNVRHVTGAGAGARDFGGVLMLEGITVQLSNAADLTGIVYEPY